MNGTAPQVALRNMPTLPFLGLFGCHPWVGSYISPPSVRSSALALLPEVRRLQVQWLVATSSRQFARLGAAPLAEPPLPDL